MKHSNKHMLNCRSRKATLVFNCYICRHQALFNTNLYIPCFTKWGDIVLMCT